MDSMMLRSLVSVTMLLLLFSNVVLCQSVPTTMSAATAENIGLQFRALMDQDVIEDEGVTSTTILLAGLVRLIFHDCVGNGCDGCINMNMTDNRGLQTYIDQVEGLYTSGHVDETPLAELISRADFWTLGAIEAINYGCEKAQGNCRRNCPPVPYPNIVFQTGRVDCPTAPYDEVEPPLPQALKGLDHVLTFFADTFGFDEKETVAILGAHTLGAAHSDASGFAGPWVNRRQNFDNAFYVDLLRSDRGWEMDRRGPRGARIYQWSSTNTNARRIMLNSDMCLVKDLGTITSEGEVACTYDECPDAPLDVLDWVKAFALDNDLFLVEFGKAFQKMINHGSSNLNDLTA